ncbi:MAG: HAD family hydrolase [Anaerolineales bacterium]
MPPRKIDAVLFDLDGTLRHNVPAGHDTLVEFLKELGHDVAPDRIPESHRWTHRYWSIDPERLADMAELGDGTPQFWARQSARQLAVLGIEGDLPAIAAEISRLFEERYKPAHHVPDDVIPTLRRLHDLGYKVGLVSNRDEPLEAIVAELGLADFFVFTLSAGQAQSWKPHPAIFTQALALAGCPPETTVYVGDNYYADVEGARAAGLLPILIDPDGFFPNPGCPVIRSLGELESALAQLAAIEPAPSD